MVLVCNPPYGERLGEADEVEAVYRELGRVCEPLTTWSYYVLTSNRWFEKHFGRRALRRRKLYNGRLECQYYQYAGPPPKTGNPPSARAATVHVILEVRDNGTPNLWAYRRAVVTIEP